MNAADFERAAIAALGSSVGWQSRISKRLGIDARTVRRWIAANQVPEWATERLSTLIGARASGEPWPRDEWMIGDALGADGRRREYIAHLQSPRFVARIVACDDDGAPEPTEEPADILSGVVYASAEMVLCEISWIDPPPSARELTQWMEAACDEIERVSDADVIR